MCRARIQAQVAGLSPRADHSTLLLCLQWSAKVHWRLQPTPSPGNGKEPLWLQGTVQEKVLQHREGFLEPMLTSIHNADHDCHSLLIPLNTTATILIPLLLTTTLCHHHHRHRHHSLLTTSIFTTTTAHYSATTTTTHHHWSPPPFLITTTTTHRHLPPLLLTFATAHHH